MRICPIRHVQKNNKSIPRIFLHIYVVNKIGYNPAIIKFCCLVNEQKSLAQLTNYFFERALVNEFLNHVKNDLLSI